MKFFMHLKTALLNKKIEERFMFAESFALLVLIIGSREGYR
jgi:hypothetical protein